MAKGGRAKVRKVMSEFAAGKLHSGSGRVVKNRRQALAIAMHEAGIGRRKTRKR